MNTLEVMTLVFLGLASVAMALVSMLAVVVICRMFGTAPLPRFSRQEKAKTNTRKSERAQVGIIEP